MVRRRSLLAASGALLARRALAGEPAAELAVLGPGDTAAGQVAATLAGAFVAEAEEGAPAGAVRVRYDGVPQRGVMDRAREVFAAKSGAYGLMLVDGACLDALAAPKLILPLDEPAAAVPVTEWYAPAVGRALQVYPDASSHRWAVPQAADALVLFVRRDWLDNPAALDALDWPAARRLFAAATAPASGRWGLGLPFRGAAGIAVAAMFIAGSGGALWQARGGQVEGVLNTPGNAAAIEAWKGLLAFAPADAPEWGVAEVEAAFASGRLFAALTWASSGPAAVPPALRDKVAVVAPPRFEAGPCSVIGGQSWVVNAFADSTQRALALRFLRWWQLPATCRRLAELGGNPCDRATLSAADFDTLQPWFGAYRAALPVATELWRDPRFPDLAEVGEEALAAVLARRAAPGPALDRAACRQQSLLFDEGTAERRPEGDCPA